MAILMGLSLAACGASKTPAAADITGCGKGNDSCCGNNAGGSGAGRHRDDGEQGQAAGMV